MQAHVLIVDDEKEPREALVYALGQKNKWWQISSAESVEEARRILDDPGERGPVDVVLTDLVIHEKTAGGIDVLEYAKRLDPFVMVILFTAQERELDRFEAYQNGAFDCVEKNILGRAAWREISVKANAALDFRQETLSRVESEKRLSSLQRFFDPRLLKAVEQDPGALSVRLRSTTFVFWNIRGYARLCSNLIDQPDLLHGFLFDYYTTTTNVLFKNTGILDKYMGDVVMGLFCDLGDQPAPRTVQPAVEAALQMRKAFDKIKAKWRVQWGEATGDAGLGLGCAIHLGDALVGNLGTHEREQFTAIGPHVNFASQLRERAEAGTILLSEAAMQSLPDIYAVEPAGVVGQTKSLPDQKIPLFRVRGRRSQ